MILNSKSLTAKLLFIKSSIQTLKPQNIRKKRKEITNKESQKPRKKNPTKMVYSYTPTYYTSLHDSITSICKNILPFSVKKRRLTAIAAAEQRQSKQQSDNLKWQQESFHQMLNLMGLCKEGILQENEVSAFRTHLLETLIASPIDHEATVILRDKLIFLQELLYANCISEDEYHTSKRPLLQRLAIQGAEIGARDVIVAGQTEISNQEWSVIDLNEDKKLKEHSWSSSSVKKIKVPKSSYISGFITLEKNGTLNEKHNKDQNIMSPRELLCSAENPFWNNVSNEKESESKSILMTSEKKTVSEKGKRKPFSTLFQRDQKEGNDRVVDDKGKVKVVKKAWGLDGFKKWKKNESEDETAPLSLIEKSDDANYHESTATSLSKQIKKKFHPTEFFADQVSGENVQKEISRVQTELSIKGIQSYLPDDRIKQVSTQLPDDNVNLKKSFQKLSCDRLDNVILNSKRWTTFDDEENAHPNLFAAPHDQTRTFSSSKNARTSFNNSSIDKGFKYNPFFDM